jgi:hypothetical protein
LAGRLHLRFPNHDYHTNSRLISTRAFQRIGDLQRTCLWREGVGRPAIELVSQAVVRRAVPFVAIATAVSEDDEAAGVSAVRLAGGIGSRPRIVQEHSGFVRRPRVIHAVEDEIRTRDVFPVYRDVKWLGSEIGHRGTSTGEAALATA